MTILIEELFRSVTGRNARKMIKHLYCDSFDIDITLTKLKSVITCSELLRNDSSQILENKEILMKKVRKKERDGK